MIVVFVFLGNGRVVGGVVQADALFAGFGVFDDKVANGDKVAQLAKMLIRHTKLCASDAEFCRNCTAFLLNVVCEMSTNPVSECFSERVWYMLVYVLPDASFLTEAEVVTVFRLAKEALKSPEMEICIYAISEILVSFSDKCAGIIPDLVQLVDEHVTADMDPKSLCRTWDV